MTKHTGRVEMHEQPLHPARRRRLLAAADLASGTLPALASNRMATPPQMRGPFYPERLPLDQDNDLTRLMDRDPSQGEITDLTGRVLDLGGTPINAALVEIWQCDANGRYRHRDDEGSRPRDPGFQGYDKTRSGSDGSYRFRTIKPVPYPGRADRQHLTKDGVRPWDLEARLSS